MKKYLCILATAAILVGVTMNVKAYETKLDGIQCCCIITGQKDVMAFTAVGMNTTTVIIRSKAYDGKCNLLGGNGNAGGGYAQTNYSTTDANIFYTVQEHEVPSYNDCKTLVEYAP